MAGLRPGPGVGATIPCPCSGPRGVEPAHQESFLEEAASIGSIALRERPEEGWKLQVGSSSGAACRGRGRRGGAITEDTQAAPHWGRSQGEPGPASGR